MGKRSGCDADGPRSLLKGSIQTAERPTIYESVNPNQRASSDVLRRFDWTTFDSPSQAVVEAVSAEDDTDPLEMEPLNGVVDTDALNSLFQPDLDSQASISGTAQFQYLGYDVQITGHGWGYLYERPGEDGAETNTPECATITDD